MEKDITNNDLARMILNIEARMATKEDLKEMEERLNSKLDHEQRFTSDTYDLFSKRLTRIEEHLNLPPLETTPNIE